MPDFEVIKPKKGARKKKDEVVDLTQLSAQKEEKPKANEDKKGIKLVWNKHEVFNLMDKKHQDIIKNYWTRKERSVPFFPKLFRDDIQDLITDKAVSNFLIDAYASLIKEEERKKKYLLPVRFFYLVQFKR